MASHDVSLLPPPQPEHRRAAAGQFERANQVIATGNYDYGIDLLLSCCKLDPANLIYRQALRRTEKTKYRNNMRGKVLAGVRTWPIRAKIKAALRARDYLKALEFCELVLARNPWDTSTQVDMADAAEALGLLDLAVWTLEQARQKDPRDAGLNRKLARMYERRGNFTQAIALWEMIRKAVPTDAEAQDKAKDLAASETIARGHYGEAVATQEEREAADAAGDGDGAPSPAAPAAPPPASRSAETPTAATPSPLDRTGGEAARLKARIDADPTNPNAYLHLAGVYRRAGQLDQARAVLEQGLGPTGNDFELSALIAELEIEPFRNNLAITEEKLKKTQADEELRRLRIRLLKEINTRELELFRLKADRYPGELGHRYELGVRLLRADQTDEAIRALQMARAEPRYRGRALLRLGYCFRRRNNWRLARRNFEDALQALAPNEEETKKEVLFELASGCAEAGELSAAVDWAHELANLDFGYREIGRLLDEWTTRLGQAGPAK